MLVFAEWFPMLHMLAVSGSPVWETDLCSVGEGTDTE